MIDKNNKDNENIEFILDTFENDDYVDDNKYLNSSQFQYDYNNLLENDIIIGDNYEDDAYNLPRPVKFKGQNKFSSFIKNVLPNKSDNIKTLTLKIISYLLIVVIIASIIYLVSYFSGNAYNDSVIDDLRTTYNDNRYDYNYNENGTFTKFDELLSQNSDTVGWISINNTVIDYPVYQTTNNDYYILHNSLGEKSSYGALFVDCNNSIKPYNKTQNVVIYGHHMRNGSMFGNLTRYNSLSYYREHPTISFDTIYEKGEYKIFAAVLADKLPETAYGIEFTFWQDEFDTQEDFLQWINLCKVRSFINTTVDVNAYDEILTLSTCSNTYYKDARFVVFARRVREGEASSVDTNNASLNSNPLYPQEYYKNKNLTPPDNVFVTSTTSSSVANNDDEIITTTPTSPSTNRPSNGVTSENNQIITSNELPLPPSEVSSTVSSEISSSSTPSETTSITSSEIVSSSVSSDISQESSDNSIPDENISSTPNEEITSSLPNVETTSSNTTEVSSTTETSTPTE